LKNLWRIDLHDPLTAVKDASQEWLRHESKNVGRMPALLHDVKTNSECARPKGGRYKGYCQSNGMNAGWKPARPTKWPAGVTHINLKAKRRPTP
jgi:hypothetical protein